MEAGSAEPHGSVLRAARQCRELPSFPLLDKQVLCGALHWWLAHIAGASRASWTVPTTRLFSQLGTLGQLSQTQYFLPAALTGALAPAGKRWGAEPCSPRGQPARVGFGLGLLTPPARGVREAAAMCPAPASCHQLTVPMPCGVSVLRSPQHPQCSGGLGLAGMGHAAACCVDPTGKAAGDGSWVCGVGSPLRAEAQGQGGRDRGRGEKDSTHSWAGWGQLCPSRPLGRWG